MNSTEIWLLISYLTVGWFLMEGITWTRKRWRIQPLQRGPMLLVFFLWPFIVGFAIMLRLGGSKGS